MLPNRKFQVSLRILDPWLPSPPGSSATGRKSSAAAPTWRRPSYTAAGSAFRLGDSLESQVGSGLYHVVSICMQKKCIDLQVVTSRGRVCPCLPCCNCSNPLTNSNQTTRAIRLYLGSAKVSAQSAALAFGVERLPCWVEFLHNEGSSHIFGGMESS